MSNQNPEQNSVEAALPPSPPPPSSQTPQAPPTPGAQTNAHFFDSDESLFFRNQDYKKLYFSTAGQGPFKVS